MHVILAYECLLFDVEDYNHTDANLCKEKSRTYEVFSGT